MLMWLAVILFLIKKLSYIFEINPTLIVLSSTQNLPQGVNPLRLSKTQAGPWFIDGFFVSALV